MSAPITLLPVELLYEIQLFATSSALPLTCKALHGIFSSSPPSYRAQYLAACTSPRYLPKDVIPHQILRYPICTKDVLEAYFRSCGKTRMGPALELPRRLFRSLVPKSAAGWTDRDQPLPFLRYLYTCPNLSPPNTNSHDGYALIKAVQAGFVPLVRLLLDHGASPSLRSHLSIMMAIYRNDLGLVRMLVERVDAPGNSTLRSTANGKRRKLEDRVEVTPEMLRTAVRCRAQDIVEYLTREKRCIPDMKTLLLMR